MPIGGWMGRRATLGRMVKRNERLVAYYDEKLLAGDHTVAEERSKTINAMLRAVELIAELERAHPKQWKPARVVPHFVPATDADDSMGDGDELEPLGGEACADTEDP
jgi:hypothetical protein